MENRGHTGQEGGATKMGGGIAAGIGLIWAAVIYFTAETLGGLWLPLLLIAAGALAFFIGRGMARESRGNRH